MMDRGRHFRCHFASVAVVFACLLTFSFVGSGMCGGGGSMMEEGEWEEFDFAQSTTHETWKLATYNREIPPVQFNNGKPVVVQVGMSVKKFTLNEAKSTFSLMSGINMEWRDSRLESIPNPKQKSEKITQYKEGQIWWPQLVLRNEVDSPGGNGEVEEKEIKPAGVAPSLDVTQQGLVSWNFKAKKIVSTCHQLKDSSKWPYESHTCNITIGLRSKKYGNTVVLNLFSEGPSSNKKEDISIENLGKNPDWKLVSSDVSRVTVDCQGPLCGPEPFVDVLKFAFTIQRNSPSYFLCITQPMWFIALVNVLGFCIPPTNPLKPILISINCTIFCVLMYFQLGLPSFPQAYPSLVVIYICNLAVVAISIIISLLVLGVSKIRDEFPPWPRLRSYLFNAKLLQALFLGHLVQHVGTVNIDGSQMLGWCDPKGAPETSGTRQQEPLDESTESDDSGRKLTPTKNGNQQSGTEQPQVPDEFLDSLDGGSALMPIDTASANPEWVLFASVVDRIYVVAYVIVYSVILTRCLSE